MSTVDSRRLLTLAVWVAGGLALMPRTAAAENTAPESKPRSVALTISGGVSLGSYEAGVNWALIRTLRAGGAKLEAVTGASAGNINTLLTAYTWCGADGSSMAPEQSIFWKSWIPVGLKTLAPREFESGYENTGDADGLLSRGAMDEPMKHLAAVANAPTTERCELELGITLSRLEPGRLNIPAGDQRQLQVDATRYVVPFMARSLPGDPLQFFAPSAADTEVRTKDLGLHLLPAAPGESISFEMIQRYVLAASAFPYAFGSLKLKHWAPVPGKGSYESSEAVFLDGGVFDNVPVGLALRLLATRPASDPTEKSFIYYIDPDQRTRAVANVCASEEKELHVAGIGPVSKFLGGAVKSARKHELQTVVRFDSERLGRTGLRLTSRSINVFGEFLMAFGAFADQRFRELDFYIGIFDGLASASEWACEAHPAGGAREACERRTFAELKQVLKLEEHSPLAAYVVERLHAHTSQESITAPSFSSSPPTSEGKLTFQEASLMLDVLLAKEHCKLPALVNEIVAAAKQKGISFEDGILSDPEGFTSEALSRLLLRALTVERNNKNESELETRGLLAANTVVRLMTPLREPRLDPSTVPGGADRFSTRASSIAHFLPYYAGLELQTDGRFGGRFQWQPTLPLGKSPFQLIAPLEVGWLAPTGFRFGAGAGVRLVLSQGLGIALDGAIGAALSARSAAQSPKTGLDALGDGTGFAAQAGLTFLNSIRAGYLWDQRTNAHFISVGLANFNGSLYWLSRIVAGQ